ncbi:TcfC E-set like domain-containing protein [Burkholderia cepacia]|uniref:TcfC E-set like domain-containing protein n=1 Tax=Burkholderia cepacia TaxID=292 RepID=UPI0020197E24|nr:TcfC E-set like domain-containing protein [Burkholderia cepacia]UQO38959.1 TcfC E-set like domain-containing protein [Burkholderia cepacia]UQO53291.1 TcfC E-set like domain-containing protein [Burkholderia cepacia]UQP07438.1 TcfC E-set like domain-containing protein [Burkholderia cepacia]
MDDSANYVATFNGRTLPDFIGFSQADGALTFDASKFEENGISGEDVSTLKRVVSQLDYKRCSKGCDVEIDGYHVTVDKMKRSISIRDAREDYIAPQTNLGIVNNQSVDLRAGSDGYRAANISANTWVGLPSRSFGYVSWYANQTSSRGYSGGDRGVSSYYLQKNFASTYVRMGKQNSVDYSAGSVSTMLSPSFDQFVTIGSQANLQVNNNVGSLILYATAEGNYEFYRNGRLIFKRPAVIGRNEISFADLPGGYYPLEVRLVDRNGNVVSSERREINNLNFNATGGNAWHFTAGKEMSSGGYLLEAGVSRNLRQFYLNTSALAGQDGKWAGEVNITRPTQIADIDIQPTLGLLAGERGVGGYVNISMASEALGSLSVSRYQNTHVSRFYTGQPSTSVSYSRSLRKATVGYNYMQSRSGGTSHQAEVRWNYRPNGLWATFALGVQKGGYQSRSGGYGVYFNTTMTLDKVQGTVNIAHVGGQTQLSGDVRRDFVDSFGTSTVGATANRVGSNYGVNLYGARSGTRGDASLNLGTSNAGSNVDFNYRGMVAASKDGVAFGRYSSSGSAMLLKTPVIDGMKYGFSVEGSPVAGNGTYAVPLNAYSDVSFARVFGNNDNLDMNIEVPANIMRAHPGQVYSAKARVDISMIYSGFMIDENGQPVSGKIVETDDTVHRNGLFSIVSKKMLRVVTVEQEGRRLTCDLKDAKGNNFLCK